MTNEEIIEMAVQAGIKRDVLMLGRNVELLEAFAKLVATKHDPKIAIADAYRAGVDSGIAAEREACAVIADGMVQAERNACAEMARDTPSLYGETQALASAIKARKGFSNAIRARGEA